MQTLIHISNQWCGLAVLGQDRSETKNRYCLVLHSGLKFGLGDLVLCCERVKHGLARLSS